MADPAIRQFGTGLPPAAAPEEPSEEEEPFEAPSDEGEPDEEPAEDGPAAATGDETFIDPATLPPELQAHFKRMQGAFTRRMQQSRDAERKAAVVDRFYSDPAYARAVIAQIAPQLGLSFSSTGTPPSPGTPVASPTPASSQDLSAQLAAELGPDLAFLAQPLGQVLQRVLAQQVHTAVAPLEHRTQAQHQAARKREEDQLMAALDASHPGWEDEYGDRMRALDDFLMSDDLTHATFGNKYELYLRLLNPDAARIEAARGMQAAGRRRVGTGRPTGSRTNIMDVIRKTRDPEQKWQIAARWAAEQPGMNGA
jgi:hypothetical protein